MGDAVTVYVPCHDGAHFLDRVLPAVLGQTHPIAELLLVDDGSRDDSAARAERLGARVIRHAGNRGLGAARNSALRAARSELVASLDADVVPEPDWLERLRPALDDERVAGASGELIESVQQSLADRWRAQHMAQSWGPRRIEDPSHLFGSNGLHRRAALFEAGLYDERCRTNGEDVAISNALRQRGWRLVYEPAARCHHLRSDDFRSLADTYRRWTHPRSLPQPGFRQTRKLRRKARRLLLERKLREDLRARRPALALIDLRMYAHWGRRDWSRYLASLAARARSSASDAEPPAVRLHAVARAR